MELASVSDTGTLGSVYALSCRQFTCGANLPRSVLPHLLLRRLISYFPYQKILGTIYRMLLSLLPSGVRHIRLESRNDLGFLGNPELQPL
jgi:hypothetical protein